MIRNLLLAIWRTASSVPLRVKFFGLLILPLAVIVVLGLINARELGFNREEYTRYTWIPIGAFVFAMGLIYLINLTMIQQLKKVLKALHVARDGDLSVRVGVWATDEIGEIQDAFNQMVERLEQSRNELNEKEGLIQQSLGMALNAQEVERKRISRELHDEVGQALTSLLLQIKNLQGENDLEIIESRLDALRVLTLKTLENVRRLSVDLRPTMLDDLGLVPAMKWYLQDCIDSGELEIDMKINNMSNRLSPEHEIVLYRVLQEGITNILRHANAKHANVLLERDENKIHFQISDDGLGMDIKDQTIRGVGLQGIEERVRLVNGAFSIESIPTQGTIIDIMIPLLETLGG